MRFVVRLAIGFVSRWGFGGEEKVVTRRDRSLGGREVVVGTREVSTSRVARSPLAASSVALPRRNLWKGNNVEKREELPDWWSISSNPSEVLGGETEHLRKEAQRLVRGNKSISLFGNSLKRYHSFIVA